MRLLSPKTKRAREENLMPVLVPSRCLLLLRPRFGRHQAIDPVIDNKLPVLFSCVLDQPVCQVRETSQCRPASSDTFVQSLVTLSLDYVRAILNAFFHESHNLGSGLQVVKLWIVRKMRLLSLRGVREVIHGSGSVNE